MNRRSKTPGISRIDQPSHRTHGFFVRVHFRGKTHSAFFADKKFGGKKAALTAAKKHHIRLQRKFGISSRLSRRWNAEVVRRKGKSGIQGVRKVVMRLGRRRRIYWQATWSPEPHVVRRRVFSSRKHGVAKARQLAIRARRAGVRSMK
jgi:hypothetical protein